MQKKDKIQIIVSSKSLTELSDDKYNQKSSALAQFLKNELAKSIVKWPKGLEQNFNFNGQTYCIKFEKDLFARKRKFNKKSNEVRFELVEDKMIGKGGFGTVRACIGVFKINQSKNPIYFNQDNKPFNIEYKQYGQRYGLLKKVKKQRLIKEFSQSEINPIELSNNIQHLNLLGEKPIIEMKKNNQSSSYAMILKKKQDYDLTSLNRAFMSSAIDNLELELSISEKFELTQALLAAYKKQLYDNKLVHRDIKPANIRFRITDDNKFKITFIDFDGAIPINSKHQYNTVSYPYTPKTDYDSKENAETSFDIYSLGILLKKLWEDEIKNITKNRNKYRTFIDIINISIIKMTDQDPEKRLKLEILQNTLNQLTPPESNMDKKEYERLFRNACKLGQTKKIIHLMKKNIDIYAKIPGKKSALCLAIENGKTKIVKILLSQISTHNIDIKNKTEAIKEILQLILPKKSDDPKKIFNNLPQEDRIIYFNMLENFFNGIDEETVSQIISEHVTECKFKTSDILDLLKECHDLPDSLLKNIFNYKSTIQIAMKNTVNYINSLKKSLYEDLEHLPKDIKNHVNQKEEHKDITEIKNALNDFFILISSSISLDENKTPHTLINNLTNQIKEGEKFLKKISDLEINISKSIDEEFPSSAYRMEESFNYVKKDTMKIIEDLDELQKKINPFDLSQTNPINTEEKNSPIENSHLKNKK